VKVEQPRQGVYRLTLHALELTALVTAARWVVEGADGQLPDEARDQLEAVLASYDGEVARIRASPGAHRP
jgi:hypothetical protein